MPLSHALDRQEAEAQYRAVGRLGFAGPTLSLDCKPEGPLAEALLVVRRPATKTRRLRSLALFLCCFQRERRLVERPRPLEVRDFEVLLFA
jgi:hypothetical protein